MRVALTVRGSSDGFGIEVSECRKPSRGTYFLVKTKWLGADSFVRAERHTEIFGALRSEQELDVAEVEKLSGLVSAIAVTLSDQGGGMLDGNLCALSIEKEYCSIALEWNSSSGVKWDGVDELVAFLGLLYERHRRRGLGP